MITRAVPETPDTLTSTQRYGAYHRALEQQFIAWLRGFMAREIASTGGEIPEPWDYHTSLALSENRSETAE